jgi:AcrR family transcriptional regulator
MPKTPATKRVRRDPETARAAILDAAERLFADHGPDAVGLKDVAGAAGVSHALVSHYFGGYDDLVEETLARRIQRIRDGALADLDGASDAAPAILLDRLASLASDRVTVRLAAWAFLTGRAKRDDFFSARHRGLKLVVDAIAGKRAKTGETQVSRDAIEFAVVSALTMVLGFGVAREALLSGLGHPTNAAFAAKFEADYRARAFEMVTGYLAAMSQRSGRR